MNKREKIVSEEDIQVLTKSEWVKRRITSELEIDPIYVIIGYINSFYGPTGNSPGDKLEIFEIDQIEKVKLFEKICRYFLTSLGMKSDIRIEKSKGYYEIQSKQITTVLKRHFSKKETFFNRNYYQLSPDDPLFNENESRIFNSKQCSYLVGVGLGRNRTENKLKFWIDYKAELVIDFLRKCEGFGDDAISVQYNFGKSTEVHLSKDSLLWTIIDDYINKVKRDTAIKTKK